MSTSSDQLTIAGIEIDVVRKDIKHMHLAVYPPDGRVRLAVPLTTDSEVMRLFAISKLAWIKKSVKGFKEQARESERSYISGESHYFKGKRFLLEVVEHEGFNSLEIIGSKKLLMKVRKGADREMRAKVMKEWYRKQLKLQVPELLEKWESVVGVTAAAWGVKQMRTKWGACNTEAKRVWLNLELAKKPTICLEYILVHELVHLHERTHNERFVALMNQFMPNWRLYRDKLNSLPIVHNDWGY